jgi:hypothetical protein
VTDARGRFVFLNLPSGLQYELWPFRTGYATTGGDVFFRVAAGEWVRDVTLRVRRLGSISGRVLDERGEPVVGTAVQLFSRRLLSGHERLMPGPVVSTNDRGAYRFPMIEKGAYYVAVLSVQATVPSDVGDAPRHLPTGGLQLSGLAGPAASRPEVRGASVDVDGRHRLVLSSFVTPPPPSADQPRVYAPVFYPSARSVNEAQAIEIDHGASRTNVDFQLAPVSAVRVSGQVTGGIPAANMILRLMPQGGEYLGFGHEVATTLVESDGRFTFLNVPAGQYTLVASPAVPEISAGGWEEGRVPRSAGYGPARALSAGYQGLSAMWWQFTAGAGGWARVPVTVGNGNVTGIEVRLQPTVSVSGRIVFDDPSQLGSTRFVPLQFEPANGDPLLSVPSAHPTPDEPTFAVSGLLAGRYLPTVVTLLNGWHLKSVTAGGTDVTTTGLDASLGRDFDDVVITLTKTGAELSGAVLDRSGRPVTGSVILFPVDQKQWIDYGFKPARILSTSARADGTFEQKTIRDGDYFVIAVPSAQSGAWTDPKFLAAAASQATRIALKTGSPATVRLSVTEVIVR